MMWPSVEFMQGLAVAGIPFAGVWLKWRLGREHRAQSLYDRIMSEVRVENAGLKAEVEACKQRDARMVVLEICFRMLLSELIKLDAQNSVLVQVKLLLEAGPLPPDSNEMDHLLSQIDRGGCNGQAG